MLIEDGVWLYCLFIFCIFTVFEWQQKIFSLLISSSYWWQINLNKIYTIIFTFIFWCVPHLLHWTITVVSKPVPILSHSFMVGIFNLLPIINNRVRGAMIGGPLCGIPPLNILSHPKFFSTLLSFGKFVVIHTIIAVFYYWINVYVRTMFCQKPTCL